MQLVVTRFFMTQLNWTYCIECRWFQYSRIHVCMWRRSAHQAAETHNVKIPRCLWKEHSRPLVTRRREQWRQRKLIILQVPRPLDGGKGEKGKERMKVPSVQERGWAPWCRWRLRKLGHRRHWASCCWRHDFAGRNFTHVLLRERLKRDEPWRWKCVSRYLVSVVFAIFK